MGYRLKENDEKTREQLDEIYTDKRIELTKHILNVIGIDSIKPCKSWKSGFHYSIAYDRMFDRIELEIRRNDRFTNEDLNAFDCLREVMKEQQCDSI